MTKSSASHHPPISGGSGKLLQKRAKSSEPQGAPATERWFLGYGFSGLIGALKLDYVIANADAANHDAQFSNFRDLFR